MKNRSFVGADKLEGWVWIPFIIGLALYAGAMLIWFKMN